MPIVNRQSDMVSLRLFGHPNILYLPSKLTGTLLYQTVDRVVPCLAYYSIHLTDGQVRISVKIPAIADMFTTNQPCNSQFSAFSSVRRCGSIVAKN